MSLEEWRSCVWKWWKLSPVGKIPRWKFQYHQIQRTRIHIKILRKRLDQVFKSAFSQKFFDYMSRSKRCSPKFLKCFINSGFVFTIPIYFHIITSNNINIYIWIFIHFISTISLPEIKIWYWKHGWIRRTYLQKRPFNIGRPLNLLQNISKVGK